MLRWLARAGGRRDVRLGWSVATGRLARMRASVADRDRAIRILKESFVDGRLAFDEFVERVGRAIEAHDFRELLALYDDLPADLFDRLPAHPGEVATGRCLGSRSRLRVSLVRRRCRAC
jgi:Domain of unknown function (DUF1707)